MIVVLTREAEDDLERIGDFIARDNPDRAVTYVQELTAQCRSLSEAPRAFPIIMRHAHLGIRRRIYGNYLIFYRIGPDQIDVLHILHGALDYEATLLRDA